MSAASGASGLPSPAGSAGMPAAASASRVPAAARAARLPSSARSTGVSSSAGSARVSAPAGPARLSAASPAVPRLTSLPHPATAMSNATAMPNATAMSGIAALPRPAPVLSVKRPAAKYFVSLPVDFLLIGGFSVVLFLVLPHLLDGSRTARVIQLGMWLTWVGNWPHFSATSHRLYGTRAHLKQYPFTAVAAPLLVALGAAGSFAAPAVVAPYFVKLLLLWSPFHYSGQTFGISQLYARRAGHRPTGLERSFLMAFIYGTFIARTLLFEASPTGSQYYGIAYPGFGVPQVLPAAANVLTYASGAVFLLLLARTCVRERKLPPLMYLLPAATQYVWFYVAGARPGFAEFVPFFHGLQYLVIAWAMNLSGKALDQKAPATPRFALNESAKWYAINVAGGAALFYVLPLIAADATGAPKALATGIVLAAVQIHHFFVDGVIWKLKSQTVASPLLVNIQELVHSEPVRAVPQGVAA
jgi:hypothetical protein